MMLLLASAQAGPLKVAVPLRAETQAPAFAAASVQAQTQVSLKFALTLESQTSVVLVSAVPIRSSAIAVTVAVQDLLAETGLALISAVAVTAKAPLLTSFPLAVRASLLAFVPLQSTARGVSRVTRMLRSRAAVALSAQRAIRAVAPGRIAIFAQAQLVAMAPGAAMQLSSPTAALKMPSGELVPVAALELSSDGGQLGWSAQIALAEAYAPLGLLPGLVVEALLAGTAFRLKVSTIAAQAVEERAPRIIVRASTPFSEDELEAPLGAIAARAYVEQALGAPVAWAVHELIIPAGRLSASAPATAVRQVLSAVGAVASVTPAGAVSVVSSVPLVSDWPSLAALTLLDDRDIFARSESSRALDSFDLVTVADRADVGRIESALAEDALTEPGAAVTLHAWADRGVAVAPTLAISAVTSATYAGASLVEYEEDVELDELGRASLPHTAQALLSHTWLGVSGGPLTLSDDGRQVLASSVPSGPALVRVRYTAQRHAWGLSLPATVAGLDDYPLIAEVSGELVPGALGAHVTAVRGDGLTPGPDIIEPLLAGVAAPLHRARVAIDTSQLGTVVRIETPLILSAKLGDIVKLGDYRLGVVTEIVHRADDSTATTELELLAA